MTRSALARPGNVLPGSFDAGARRTDAATEFELVLGVAHAELFPNDFVEPIDREELRDAELADGNHQSGLKNLELAVTPVGAVRYFIPRGHAVAALRLLAGKTAARRGHVDTGTKFWFVHAGRVFEPLEERLACGPREGSAQYRLLVARRLTDENVLPTIGPPLTTGLCMSDTLYASNCFT
jgi:hypothetical protein